MTTKARELEPTKQGDRNACPTCRPPDPAKRITMDRLWHWSLAHPGQKPFRDQRGSVG